MKVRPILDLDNARLEEQREAMQQIIESGQCPFCLENLPDAHRDQILKRGHFWVITPNRWPYNHTRVHLLAIYHQHVEHLSELDPAAGAELVELFQWAAREYQVEGGALAMRFGDTNLSAGTVAHLHAQFIVPNIDNPDYDDDPVRLTIGKTWLKRGLNPPQTSIKIDKV